MSANVEGLVREGINAIKAGKKDEGRALLLKAVELDQYNEQAWLWLSGVLDSLEDQRTCLENVLAINPNNERAKKGIDYLATLEAGGGASTPSQPAPSPLQARATATSVEWDIPAPPSLTPPPWQAPAPKEPTQADLDAWVSTLNLPTTQGSTANDSTFETGTPAAPFTEFDIDDDDFLRASVAAPSFGSFDDSDYEIEPPPPPRRMPVATTPSPMVDVPEPAVEDEDEDDVTSLLYDIDQDADEAFLEPGEGELFSDIPAEIKPTRLPGTRERAPVLLVLLAVVLVLANIGAAAWFAISFLNA